MGCNMSYNPAFDGPLIQQAPPCKPYWSCRSTGAWGFILQQRLFSLSGNDFKVRNMLGQDVVVVSGKVLTLSRRTMIRGVDGSPIVEISKKILGFHSTHYLTNPATGKVIATARLRLSSYFPRIELYEGEAYDQPAALMFTLGGDIFGFRWSVISKYNQCVAKAVHTSGFAGGFNTYGYNIMPDTYMVDVAAGVDSIFVLALVVIMEEIHEEREDSARSRSSF
jgi:uncharacterized protein YxjI